MRIVDSFRLCRRLADQLNRRLTAQLFRKCTARTSILLCVAVVVLQFSTPKSYGQCQIKKITASNASEFDWFGFGLAATEDVIVVAARGDANQETAARNAYIFEKVNGLWTESAILAADQDDAPDRFGRSVAVDGATILVGDTQFDLTGMGAVYFFEKQGEVWEHADVFTGVQNTAFGISSAISGNTAMVGASAAQFNGVFSGVVFVYERVSGIWVSAGKLSPPDGNDFDQFGVSVGLSGNIAVIGAFRGEVDEIETGTAYIYERIDGVWTFVTKIMADDRAESDMFGHDVAISGEIVVIGADSHDDLGSLSGAAYLFEKVEGVWTQTKKLLADDGMSTDLFGSSVGVSGQTVVVGARQDDDQGSASGSGYVFRKLSGVWTQTAKLLASDGARIDFFGKSMVIGGGTIVVGASGNDDVADRSGSAYIFNLPCDDCNGNGVPDIEETVAHGDFNNDGFVDLTDFRALIDCLGGPATPPDPNISECAFMCLDAFDFDGSGTVDLKDVAEF